MSQRDRTEEVVEAMARAPKRTREESIRYVVSLLDRHIGETDNVDDLDAAEAHGLIKTFVGLLSTRGFELTAEGLVAMRGRTKLALYEPPSDIRAAIRGETNG